MYGDVVLGLKPESTRPRTIPFEVALEREEARARRRRSTPSSTPTTCASWSHEFKALIKMRTRRRLPRGPAASSSGARSAPCSARGRTPRAITYRKLNDIPDELGHRRQRAGDGVRQPGRRLRAPASPSRATRRPASNALLRRVPDERAGRGRRRRHPHAAADHTRRSIEARACEGIDESERRRARGGDAAVCKQLAKSPTSSSSTTATCRTSSSRSSSGTLYMLQTRDREAHRAAPPCKIAVDMVKREADRPRRRARRRVDAERARPAARTRHFDSEGATDGRLIAQGPRRRRPAPRPAQSCSQRRGRRDGRRATARR